MDKAISEIEFDYSILTYSVNIVVFRKFLKYIFDSICEKTPQGKLIVSLHTFHNLIGLPFHISTRIYRNLLVLNEEYMSQSSFIKGMILLYIGDFKSRCQLLYKIVDYDNNGIITHNDFGLILHHLNFGIIQNELNSSIEVICSNKEEFDSVDGFIDLLRTKGNYFILFFGCLMINKPFQQESLELFASVVNEKKPDMNKEHLNGNGSTLSNVGNISKIICDPNIFYPIHHFLKQSIQSQPTENVLGNQYVLLKDCLFFLGEVKVLPLRNSFISKTDDLMLNLYSCNEKNPPISIAFNDDKSKSNFIQIYNEVREVRFLETHYSEIKIVFEDDSLTCSIVQHSQTNEYFLMKTVTKSPLTSAGIKWGKSIFTFLSYHPHNSILRSIEMFETYNKAYFIYEYFEFESLQSFLVSNTKIIEDHVIKKILISICQGIQFLHFYGIVHRDIKPDNLFINFSKGNCRLKVGGFLLSAVIPPIPGNYDNCGTLVFSSPQINSNQPYTYKTDIWSLGIIAYYLKYAKFPFDDDSLIELSNKIKSGQYEIQEEVENSKENGQCSINQLIKECIIVNEQERKNINEICENFIM